MNKYKKFAGVIAVLLAVLVFAGASAVFAQGPKQPGGTPSPLLNQGENEAGTGMGLQSVDEATKHQAIADALGITLVEFEAAVANGEDAFTMALKQGIDFAKVQAAMDAVHQAAFQQAIDDGLVSQEQANWILSHRYGQSGQGNAQNQDQNVSSSGAIVRRAGNNGGQAGDCQYQTP